MLTFDPSSRISAEAALEHPYHHIWHDASDEPRCPTTIDSNFEAVEDISEMKKMIIEEVTRFKQLVCTKPEQQQDTQAVVPEPGAMPIPQSGDQSAEDPQPQET